jgi:VWA domain-containing protein
VTRAIPLSAMDAVRQRARRTLIVRVVLACALVGTLAAVFIGSHETKRGSGLLPIGSSPIIALDLSWSVSYDKSKLIERTIRDFAGSGRRLGLVLFSDTAYEALPPGTRSDALKPYIRFFRGDGQPNPWTDSFSAGTRISAALDLARRILRRDHVAHGSVVLITDLADAPNDAPELARTLVAYARDSIPLQIVAVNPAKEDDHLFRGALRSGGGTVTTLRSGPGGDTLPRGRPSFPVGVVVAVGLLALLLGLNEQALGALSWGRRRAA